MSPAVHTEVSVRPSCLLFHLTVLLTSGPVAAPVPPAEPGAEAAILDALPVLEITDEGLPELFIRDIPPVSTVDLEVTRPEIYFGEQTTEFSLVGTTEDEFDYPTGETNQFTRYAGRGRLVRRYTNMSLFLNTRHFGL